MWTNEKAEVGRVREGQRREEKRRRKKIRKEKESEDRKDAGAWKGSKVAKHCAPPMICGSGRSKSRLAKAGGAEPPGEMRDEKLHAVVTRSTFRSKKHTNVGTLLEDEMFKKCTALWREARQNLQNTPFSEHFWKLRCWKSAHRCGAKHMSKSKC